MFNRIAKNYDLLNTILSFGQDKRWRNKFIKLIIQQSAKNKNSVHNLQSNLVSAKKQHKITSDNIYLDLATGSGQVLFNLFKLHPLVFDKLIGIDISKNMIDLADKKLAQIIAKNKRKDKKTAKNSKKNSMVNNTHYNNHIKKIQFICSDVRSLSFDDSSIMCISIAFGLRNVQAIPEALCEFHRVLKSGSSLFVLEFFQTKKSLLSYVFDFYFKFILPLIGALFGRYKEYKYLPKSVSSFYKYQDLKNLACRTGFKVRKEHKFLFGGCRIVEFIKITNN